MDIIDNLGKADFNEFVRALDALKRRHRRVTGNILLDPIQLRRIMNKKQCVMLEWKDLVILLELRHGAFYELYYSAKDPAALSDGLKKLKKEHLPSLPLVCTIAGRQDLLESICPVFTENDFELQKKHAKTLVNKVADEYVKALEMILDGEAEGDFARPEEADAVLEMLLEDFDLYLDSLPELEEILENINRKQVAVVRRNGRLAALYYFDIKNDVEYGIFTQCRKEFRREQLFLKLSLFMRGYFKANGIVPKWRHGWRDVDNARLMRIAASRNEHPTGVYIYKLVLGNPDRGPARKRI